MKSEELIALLEGLHNPPYLDLSADIFDLKVGHCIFLPTHPEVVNQMINLACIKSNDLVYDLGCGDGRILIAAAKRFDCRCIGVEKNPELLRVARQQVRQLGLRDRIQLVRKDLFRFDWSDADVICMFLCAEYIEQLLPRLPSLKKGARIVSFGFGFPRAKPVRKYKTISNPYSNIEPAIYKWTIAR